MYTNYMFFKENLATLRKNKNLSQNDLSKKLCVKRYNISDWEQGRSEPPIEMLCKISNFFGYSTDDLLNYNLSIMKKDDINFCKLNSR